MSRWLLSLGSTLLGVAAGSELAVMLGRAPYLPALGYGFMLGLPSLVVWFLVVSPMALRVRHDLWIFRPLVAPAFGAACGVAVSVLVQAIPVALLGSRENPFTFALVGGAVGIVTWTTCALLSRYWLGHRRTGDRVTSPTSQA
jgi:hypothetical protein